MLRRLALAVAVLALAACPKPQPVEDAGTDAGPMTLKPCLDRPGELPAAPGSSLPCDLLPPSFGQ